MTRFLSTPSARRATDDPEKYPDIPEFLSTPSARRATEGPEQPGQWPRYFYPRPPRAGRLGTVAVTTGDDLFLSTPSARRATRFCADDIPLYKISIHALREEGDLMSRPMERCHSYFYPRPPRGGRRGKKMVGVASNKFLSTPSARRATGKPRPWRRHKKFSIHALREEGDAINLDLAKFVLHFYPRPPRGGRLVAASAFTPLSNFYPRPPRGGRPKRTNC